MACGSESPWFFVEEGKVRLEAVVNAKNLPSVCPG